MVFFAACSQFLQLLDMRRKESIDGDDKALDGVPRRVELLGRDGGAVELLNRNLKKRSSVSAETGGDGVSTV